MELTFLLKKFATELLLPPFNLLLLGVIGLLILRRWPRAARVALWTSVLGIAFFATPAVTRMLMRPLLTAPTLDLSAKTSAQAIVVLGGGLRSNTGEYGDTPSQHTLDRIRYGATVARRTGLPILVTGGAVTSRTAEAVMMATTLKDEFNVPVKWIESKSLDTAENFRYSAEILKKEGIATIIVVTHDFHMRRALAQCEKTGLVCLPGPVSLQGHDGVGWWFYELPDAGALRLSALALHEWLGLMALSIS